MPNARTPTSDTTRAAAAGAPRRGVPGVASAALRMSWRRAPWLAPVVLALLLARRLRRAGRPLNAPTIYTLY